MVTIISAARAPSPRFTLASGASMRSRTFDLNGSARTITVSCNQGAGSSESLPPDPDHTCDERCAILRDIDVGRSGETRAPCVDAHDGVTLVPGGDVQWAAGTSAGAACDLRHTEPRTVAVVERERVARRRCGCERVRDRQIGEAQLAVADLDRIEWVDALEPVLRCLALARDQRVDEPRSRLRVAQ